MKYIKITDKSQSKSLNDLEKLSDLKRVCFTKRDVRAGWIGPGIPKTEKEDFRGLARWATEHWYMYESFLNKVENFDNSNILDVGCGIGHSTINIATLFPKSKITGIDFDTDAINFANKYNRIKNINYICNNFLKYKTKEKYKYIFALEIFEHLPPLLHNLFIKKCFYLLEPGGKLFLTTPNEPESKDSIYGHIGFLNRARAKKFIAQYKPNIIQSSFISNKELLTGNPNTFIIYEPIESFEIKTEIKSHFRLILANKNKPPNLSYLWYISYYTLAIFSKFKIELKKHNILK